MKGNSRKAAFFSLVVIWAIGSLNIQSAAAQGPKAEDVYKDIQVFKGASADLLGRTMQFMEASLGIHCDYCHGEANWPDNPSVKTDRKEYARKKIRMVNDLNKTMFEGREVVNCNTCHRGHLNPVVMLPFGGQEPPLAPAGKIPPPNPGAGAPTVDQIFDKYTAALGGANAIRRASNRIDKGFVTNFGHVDEMHAQRPAPSRNAVEVYTKGDKHMMVNKGANGDSVTVFDGAIAWTPSNDRSAMRQLRVNELSAEIIADAALNPVRLKQVVNGMRVQGSDKIGDRDVWVVSGTMTLLPAVRLYFDKATGLLARIFYGQQSSYCCHTIQTDYDDYHTVAGVTIPYRTTELGIRDSRTVQQLTEVTLDATIEDSRFARPAAMIPPWASYASWTK